MDNAGRMRGIQTVGDLDGERKQSVDWDRLSQDAMLQRTSIQELHHNERAVLVPLDLVYRANIGMVQG